MQGFEDFAICPQCCIVTVVIAVIEDDYSCLKFDLDQI